jgi:hypothetical protein
VQFATCAALAAETARGLGGGEGADGGTAAATAADPPSTLTQDAPAPAAPTVEDATPRVGALDASGAPDLGSSAPLLDASLATVCAAKGAWEAFDNEVLRQTNASHVEARVCVTDAEQGASAAAAAAAEALAAAKREALAKKKEKEKEKKIPSLRDFKSDLEAKVADARDAKKGKKEAEQKEKEPREPRGGDGKDAKEVREAEAEARRESTSTRKNSDGFADDEENARRRGEELNDEERRAEPTREPSDAGYEPVPTPSVARRAEKTAFDAKKADQGRDARGESNDAAKKNGESNGAASANANGATTASPRDGGGEDEALASPVPKPTPTADHAEGGSVAGTGEQKRSPDGAATGASDAGPTSSPPEASGEPSVEPTPVSLAALLEDADAAGAAREAEATPVAERLDVDSGKGFSTSSPSPDDPRERESRDDDGPPSPTTDAVPRSEGPGYSSTAEGADAAGRPRTSRVSGEASEQRDALGSTDASVSTDRGESDDDAPPRAPTESESESESDPTESDRPDETRRSLVATPVPPEVRDAYASEVNYAAASNGAKVVSANPESKSTAGAALKENKDSYYLSPCLTSGEEGKWITVELSEEIAVTAVTVANYEFHSSAPRAFEVWGTSGPADKEDGYRLILEAIADQRREPQTFEVRPRGAPGGGAWSKHVKFKFTSHYGSFHFCTLSLLRVHGKDATQTLKEEMEAIDAEAREVEAILRENDESFLREKEKEEAEARAREEAEENARRESQAAARRVLDTVRGEGKGGILSETADTDESGDGDETSDASDDETETENETENEEASSREDGQDSARAGATNGGPLSVSGGASEIASSPGSVEAREPDSSNDATTRPSESRDDRAGRKSDVVVSEKEKDARETSTEDEPSYPDETSTSSPTKAEEKRDAVHSG